MDILLTHAYFLKEDPKEQEIMRPYVPLGILYISAYLEKNNFKNQIFDSTFETKKNQLKFIQDLNPKILAIYTNLMTKVNVIELIQRVKSNEKLKQTQIVLGGPDVTYNVENYLKAGADFLVIGEGEQTMLELSEAILKNTEFSSISGIAYKYGDEVVQNTVREKLKDIDDLPLPNRQKIDINLYLNAWKEYHGSNSLTISTQRGCPYTCKWCSTAVYGMSYRRRSPEKVVEELILLKEQYNPDSFWFVDDVFTVSHKWLAAFKEELQKKQLIISFECITRADRMNEDVIKTLKECGCKRVWIGAESGSQKIIDAMDRRVDVNQVRDMIKLSKQHGIESGTFIMLGYPGESQDDIDETIHHLILSNPDQFTITVAYPIKGTSLFEEVETLQLNDLPWNITTDRDRDFKRTYSRRYYDFAVKHVVNKVNFHKRKNLNQHLTLEGFKLLLKSRLARSFMDLERLRNRS